MNALRWISELLGEIFKSRAVKQYLAVGLVVLLMVGLCAGIWRFWGPDVTHEAGCGNPGELTSTVLPQLDPHWVKVAENPCFDVGELVTTMIGAIPADEESQVQVFLKRLDGIASRLDEIHGVAECGYTTDRLAVSLYQDQEHPWAVGMVGVLRGDVDAMLEMSDCFLFSEILPLTTTTDEPPASSEPSATIVPQAAPPIDRNQPTLCSSAVLRRVDNESYTIIYAASSQSLCLALAYGVRSSDGPVPTPTRTATPTPAPTSTGGVPGPTATLPGTTPPDEPSSIDRARSATVLEPSPGIAVREGPGLTYREIARVNRGLFGTVMCFTEGVYVAGPFGDSRYWDRISIDGQAGFVADAFVDTGSDIEVASRPCTVDERTAFLTGVVNASPDVALRASPDIASAELGRAPGGMRLRVLCIAEGTPVLGDNRWAHVELDKAIGFIAVAYLDIDGDLTVASRPC